MDAKARRTQVLDEARKLAEAVKAAGRDFTADEQRQIDEHLDEVKALNRRIRSEEKGAEIMRQLDAQAAELHARQEGAQPGDDTRRLSFKDMAGAASRKILGDGILGKAVAPSGATVVPQGFTPDVVALGQPAVNLLSVIPVVQQDSQQFAYLRQTVRTSAAAVVAEGAVKPTSTYTLTRVEDSLDVIAHLSEGVPRFWFADNASLQTFLSNELVYGLQVKVEAQIVADIAGTSGIQTNAYATSPLVTVRKSLTKLSANGYDPAVIALHPTDFEAIELALATVNAVEHIGLPFDPAAQRLWGVPIVQTIAVAVGTAYTLAAGAVALNTDRAGVAVTWSETSNADDFSRNLLRARCEGRYVTSVYSPLGVVTSDLTA